MLLLRLKTVIAAAAATLLVAACGGLSLSGDKIDYKSTAKNAEITIDEDWQIGYKRQMEIYQWLFKMNGFKVYPVGYFVYCNGDATKEAFNNRLDFEISLIPYKGDTSWVDNKILEIYQCLQGSQLPQQGDDCDYCKYRGAVGEYEK